MDNQETQKLDLFSLLGDVIKTGRRFLVLGLVLVVLGGGVLAFRQYRNYTPMYAATASFTVKVTNPLYAGIPSYNTETAEQMARTFPYILTSGVLQERVKNHLGLPFMPAVSVTASIGSSVLTMTVRDTDPQRARDVLEAVITYYPEIAEFVVGPTRLVLLDENGVPETPANPLNVKRSVVQGAVIGFALWMVLVVALAMTKNTVRTQEELGKMLSIPCIGQVPAVKLSKSVPCPVLSEVRSRGGFSEAVRLLRLRTEKSLQEQNKQVLLISSAVPGEGKTTVSVNLAASWAKKGKQVLIIDADLRNPSVARALHVQADRYFESFLRGEATLLDVTVQTAIPNLSLITGGPGGRAATELLSQERTARMILACKKLYDYVIVDTPPCSLLADASEIAELAECGLLVVRQDAATRDQILDGVSRLGDGKLPLIGCVFNCVTHGLTDTYGYGRGYGYGYGEK